MINDQEIRVISHHELVQTALQLKADNWRLVQMCATRIPDGYELSYSFALDYKLICIRFSILVDDEIMSISTVFAPAFLYENEMKDLFGVKIKLISIDYDGNLYRIDKKTPYKNLKGTENICPQEV